MRRGFASLFREHRNLLGKPAGDYPSLLIFHLEIEYPGTLQRSLHMLFQRLAIRTGNRFHKIVLQSLHTIEDRLSHQLFNDPVPAANDRAGKKGDQQWPVSV
ncbi:MAG: hypothetical protein D6736_15790 [Nitrospinota bacterium]|nr:MAG: hypothetical protein D6736_15790 [Nitrospinota bacterium]